MITPEQADEIYELAGTVPLVVVEPSGRTALEHNGVTYSRSPVETFNDLVERFLFDLRQRKHTQEALEGAVKRADQAQAEAAEAEAEAARLEEERNRTPLQQAEHAWAEAIEDLPTFNGLAMAATNIVVHLINTQHFDSNDELIEALCWVQAEVIDTLLEFDDAPFYEGSLLALAGDLINMNFACDEEEEV